MTPDVQQLRIEGIYEQKQPGNFMLRVKVPAGVLSSEQALKVCDIAERFHTGGIHITTRTSIEFHWLQRADLDEARRMLAAGGLTSRGACGGAVRGVVCSTPFSAAFPALQIAGEQTAPPFHRQRALRRAPQEVQDRRRWRLPGGPTPYPGHRPGPVRSGQLRRLDGRRAGARARSRFPPGAGRDRRAG